MVSWKIAVDLLAMEKTDEGDRAIFKNKTEAIFTQPDAVILAGRFEASEVRNLLESFCQLDLFDDFPDPAQQPRISNHGQVRIERFAEGGFHAARARRWKILLRLTGRD